MLCKRADKESFVRLLVPEYSFVMLDLVDGQQKQRFNAARRMIFLIYLYDGKCKATTNTEYSNASIVNIIDENTCTKNFKQSPDDCLSAADVRDCIFFSAEVG